MGSIRLPAGSFRVCLGSFTQPWSFGPYARQLTVLAGQLAKKHVVMWLALGYHDTEVRIKVPGLPENVGMLGGDFPRNQGVYVSSINALLELATRVVAREWNAYCAGSAGQTRAQQPETCCRDRAPALVCGCARIRRRVRRADGAASG